MKRKCILSLLLVVCILSLGNDLYSQKREFRVKPGAIEIEELRTFNSKTFKNPDGTRTVAISTGNLHKLDQSTHKLIDLELDGSKKDIDPITAEVNGPIEAGVRLNSSVYSRVPFNNAGLTSNGIERCYKDWPLSIIPPGVNVTDAYFTLDPIPTIYSTSFKVNSMEEDPFPVTTSAETIYNDIGNQNSSGVTYFEGSFTNEDEIFVQGDANFIAKIETEINNPFPYVAIGIKVNNESSQNDYISLRTATILYITYDPIQIPEYQLVVYDTFISSTLGYTDVRQMTLVNAGTHGQDMIVKFTVLDQPSWLSVTPSQITLPNNGPHDVSVNYLQNNYTMQYRSAIIKTETLSPPPAFVLGGIHYSFVTQDPVHFYTHHASLEDYHYYGGIEQIEVLTAAAYAIQENYNVTSNDSWLIPDINSGITHLDNINLTILPNNTFSQRTGSITISGTNIVPHEVFVTQEGIPATVTLPDDEISGLQEYYASDWIITNVFNVGTGGNVENLTLGAGNYVNLKPGFHAYPTGSNKFRAYILSSQLDNISSKPVSTKSLTYGKNTVEEGDKIESIELPSDFEISQNYPNPFNPVTTIKYALPVDSRVSIKIYDMLGREVATLVNDDKQAGYYQVRFDASNIASGIYFYRIIAGDYVKSYKMVIVK